MLKKYTIFLFAVLISVPAFAESSSPDLEGRISHIHYPGSVVVVRNELTNAIGLRDYRVKVKQGMINDYKQSDRLKIWLNPDEPKEALMIERVSR